MPRRYSKLEAMDDWEWKLLTMVWPAKRVTSFRVVHSSWWGGLGRGPGAYGAETW